jgi:hypothetical protein
MDVLLNGICSTINSSPAYLRHHKRQVVTRTVSAAPIATLSFELARPSLLNHPFVAHAGLSADKIYRVILEMLCPTKTASISSAVVDATTHFNTMHHKVICKHCGIAGMFERKYGSGGHTCQACGIADYQDVHFGEPFWLGVDQTRTHWEVMPSSEDAKDSEHISAIDRVGVLIRASDDIRFQAMHILREYRKKNRIASIEVVAASALILATNPYIIETQEIEVPLRPPTPFVCLVCKSAWSRNVDARVCCRNKSNFKLSKVRRHKSSVHGLARPEFKLDDEEALVAME